MARELTQLLLVVRGSVTAKDNGLRHFASFLWCIHEIVENFSRGIFALAGKWCSSCFLTPNRHGNVNKLSE
jgi:hypothetical protein